MAYISEVCVVSLVGRLVVSWASGSLRCFGLLSIFLLSALVGCVAHLLLYSPWLGAGTRLKSSD